MDTLQVGSAGGVCETSHAALRVAHGYARRLQLSQDDAEDCAMEFVVCLLMQRRGQRRGDEASLTSSLSWVRRCARNHALNYHRALTRTSQHLASDVPAMALAGLSAVLGMTGPEEACLLGELSDRLGQALALLSVSQLHIFLRYHTEGETVREIAASVGRTPGAVKQSLAHTRKQLRGFLRRGGLTEVEAADYLCALSRCRQDEAGVVEQGGEGNREWEA